MRLRTQFGILIGILFVVLTAVIGALQAHWLNALVINHTSNRMRTVIRSGWQILESHQRQLLTIAELTAEGDALRASLPGNRTAPQPRLRRLAERFDLDVASVLWADGTVRTRHASDRHGDIVELPLVQRTLETQSPHDGIAVVPYDVIIREGRAAAMRCTHDGQPMDAMLLYAVAPIAGATGETQGAVLVGRLLNKADAIVDEIHHAIFSNAFYKGKSIGTATIFLGNTRIATTVRHDGNRAVGTTVSDEVAQQVLGQGKPWTGRAWVVNDWYLSRYDLITGAHGQALGMLYIGELEQLYTDVKRDTLLASVGVVALVMLLGFLVSWRLSRRPFRQIESLDRATERFANGDLKARVDEGSADEIGDLCRSFNTMASQIEDDRNRIVEQRDAIESANRNYMDMLGFVTHELRSTVSAALFNANLLKDGSYGTLSDDQREGVDLVTEALERLEEITSNYLQLSIIEQGELVVSRSPTRLLRDVVTPVVNGLRRQADHRGMTIEVEIDDAMEVAADANLLRVVYENLIGNAIKYGRENGRISIDARREEGRATLRVCNEGQGIDQERLPTLFRKFQRYDVDEETGRRGTGLGLFIVKRIVEQHGGEVWIEPSERGVCFAFTIVT